MPTDIIVKDFYLRCLYHFDNREKTKFISTVKDQGVVVYLIGGASLEMMQDESLYIIKNMKEGSELGFNVDGTLTEYKAIPIPKSKDALTINPQLNTRKNQLRDV